MSWRKLFETYQQEGKLYDVSQKNNLAIDKKKVYLGLFTGINGHCCELGVMVLSDDFLDEEVDRGVAREVAHPTRCPRDVDKCHIV